MADLIDKLTGMVLGGGPQPWWVYALAIFIPFCILLCIREAFCWFWKINKLVNRLERLELRLGGLQTALTHLNARPRPEPVHTAADLSIDEKDYSLK